MLRSRRIAAVLVCAASLALALAAPAAAREARIAVATPAGPGPAQYNQVWVDQYGPKKAKRVLVLMPGTSGGSGDFTLTARHLVETIKGLQVWSIDRRTQALERPEVFQQALRGEVNLQQMFDHYLGWLAGAPAPGHYEPLDGAAVPFARQWGMKVALEDARAVVLKARAKGKRQVILGGHSLGASLTAAYAAWDFKGRPGYRDIDGMILIDGGLLGSFANPSLDEARQAIQDLDAADDPFLDLLGLGFLPEAAGIFAEVGGIYARLAGAEPATTLQGFPLLPPAFNPPFPVTNRGLLGYAFDRDTSPPSLGLLHINAGSLSGSGNPQDWTDGGVTPVSRLIATFGQEPGNGVEWFFPRRLTIDTDGANEMTRNDVADYLGLRLFHLRKVDDPLYAIQTDLTNGRVLTGASNFIARAKTRQKQSRLVNADPEQAHLDPLMAAPETNAFYRTVVPFLCKKVFPLAGTDKGESGGKGNKAKGAKAKGGGCLRSAKKPKQGKGGK